MIEIPVPGLVVLIGAAGAGKSTLAARLFAPAEVLSSDALRGAISGDPADQRATRPAFAILHREVRRRLAAGRLVVVDATNLEAGARAPLIRMARDAGVPAIAIGVMPPAADVHARNAARRERVVPSDVVDRHLARLARLGPDPDATRSQLLGEGFLAAHVLDTLRALDTVDVVRFEMPIQGRIQALPNAIRDDPSAQARAGGDAAPAPQPSRTRPKARTRSSTQTPFRR